MRQKSPETEIKYSPRLDSSGTSDISALEAGKSLTLPLLLAILRIRKLKEESVTERMYGAPLSRFNPDKFFSRLAFNYILLQPQGLLD